MTPTLIGRWQTRVALLWTVGAVLTFFYMLLFGAFEQPAGSQVRWELFLLLGYVTLLGLVWDIFYVYLQSYRWDRDWPLAYQFFAGMAEGALVFALFYGGLLTGVLYDPGDGWRFAAHYGTVFLATYLWLYGPMKVLLPQWRFFGGQLFPDLAQSPSARLPRRTGKLGRARPGREAHPGPVLDVATSSAPDVARAARVSVKEERG